VAHAEQPVPGLEESDVDLRRVFVDARQSERIEIVLDDCPSLIVFAWCIASL
jgi:hypothetical protein